MLFSATMPGAIVALARRYMTPADAHPRDGRPGRERAHRQGDRAVRLPRARAGQGRDAVAASCRPADRGLTIVFSRTKRTAAKVAEDLAERGFAAAAIHGDLGQGAREQALRAFRHGKVDVLVATDVAARGIDVENVTHVINYQCPEDEKTYVHRIGRTGRAGNTGIAVTFVDWDDMPRWGLINTPARPRHPRPRGDLLLVRPPVHRARHPRPTSRGGCASAADPRRARRGGARGPRRDRARPRDAAPASPLTIAATARVATTAAARVAANAGRRSGTRTGPRSGRAATGTVVARCAPKTVSEAQRPPQLPSSPPSSPRSRPTGHAVVAVAAARARAPVRTRPLRRPRAERGTRPHDTGSRVPRTPPSRGRTLPDRRHDHRSASFRVMSGAGACRSGAVNRARVAISAATVANVTMPGSQPRSCRTSCRTP